MLPSHALGCRFDGPSSFGTAPRPDLSCDPATAYEEDGSGTTRDCDNSERKERRIPVLSISPAIAVLHMDISGSAKLRRGPIGRSCVGEPSAGEVRRMTPLEDDEPAGSEKSAGNDSALHLSGSLLLPRRCCRARHDKALPEGGLSLTGSAS